MLEFFGRFFETTMLNPHGICLLWRPELMWTHIIADSLIGLAYFSIPLALGVFLYHRRDMRFGWAIWMFVAFIMLCGVTHFMAIVTLYKPYYGVEALLKLFTAMVSVATAIALWPMLPKAIALPSGTKLRQMIEERDRALSKMIEMEEHDKRQRLLLNELNHRVKNTLTAVQSIAAQSIVGTRSAEDFKDTFEERLMALSRTHNVLVERSWQKANLSAVVKSTLTHYGKPFRYIGPEISLDANYSVTMGMAIHELATNCLKYGAWSDSGEVAVRVYADKETITVQWEEAGGPIVYQPESNGFGTKLLTRGVAREMNAAVKMDYKLQGLVCTISFPASERIGIA